MHLHVEMNTRLCMYSWPCIQAGVMDSNTWCCTSSSVNSQEKQLGSIKAQSLLNIWLPCLREWGLHG